MEVPAGQDGIQRLLAAEQEAQAVVAAARRAKSDRLKLAKAEADREVAEYKKAREAEYQKHVADDSSSNQETVARLTAESEKAVAAVNDATSTKKESVLSFLLEHVTAVKY